MSTTGATIAREVGIPVDGDTPDTSRNARWSDADVAELVEAVREADKEIRYMLEHNASDVNLSLPAQIILKHRAYDLARVLVNFDAKK